MSRYGADRRLNLPRVATRIDDHRPCAQCGYNLRGLMSNGQCPECGAAIVAPKMIDDALYNAPESLIRVFQVGAWLAALSTAGWVGMRLVGGAIAPDPDARLAIRAACVALWLVAVWLLTPSLALPGAHSRGFGPGSPLRQAARWLQLGWLISLGSELLANSSLGAGGGSGTLLNVASVIGALAGVAGVLCVAIMLARFADWVRDDFAERCFNFTLSGLAISLPCIVLFPVLVAVAGGLLAWFFPIVMIISVILLIGAVVALPIGLFSLARSLDWSITHQHEKRQRDAELRERVDAQHTISRTPDWTEDKPIELAPASHTPVPIEELGAVKRRRPEGELRNQPRPPGEVF